MFLGLITYEFKERRNVFTVFTVHRTLRNTALSNGKFTNKGTLLLISAAFLATHSPAMSISFENVAKTTEVQISCTLCNWCPRSVNPGDSVTDKLITVQTCFSVYKAHLSRKSVWHIFRCLSEEDEQISLKTKYPERKQGMTVYKYSHTKIFKLWPRISGVGLVPGCLRSTAFCIILALITTIHDITIQTIYLVCFQARHMANDCLYQQNNGVL